MLFAVKRFAHIETTAIKAGVGDRVASIAKPIARGIDRVLGTRLQDCMSCEDRQQWLNELFSR